MRASSRLERIRTATLAAAIAALSTTATLHAQEAAQIAPDLLTMFGVVPADLYDPATSQIPRRRPGHPYEAPAEFTIQNPNGVPPAPIDQVGSFLPVPNRWRIMETLGYQFPWYDPYNQNIWKGDKPIDGKDRFLSFNFISDTVLQPRTVPTPVGPQSSTNPGENDVIGRFHQTVFSETLIASADFYKGDTTFKPPEYEFKATLALNYNRVETDEVRALQIDPRLGVDARRRFRRRAGTVLPEGPAHRRRTFRFRRSAHRHPAVFERLPRLPVSGQHARRAFLRQPRQQPLAIQHRLVPAARKGSELGPQRRHQGAARRKHLHLRPVPAGPAVARFHFAGNHPVQPQPRRQVLRFERIPAAAVGDRARAVARHSM